MIGHVSPEAYEGGPIALVQNGDTIVIDSTNKTLHLVMICMCFFSVHSYLFYIAVASLSVYLT